MSLVGMLADHLTPEAFRELGRAIGAEQTAARRSTASAVTMLLGALVRSLTSDVAAQELHRSIVSGYDGHLLDRVEEFLAGRLPQPAPANDVLGYSRGTIEQNLSQRTGLRPESTHRLISLLAPLFMSLLAARQREGELDSQRLADEIVREHQEIWQKEPQAMESLSRLLEEQGDVDRWVEAGMRSLD